MDFSIIKLQTFLFLSQFEFEFWHLQEKSLNAQKNSIYYI